MSRPFRRSGSRIRVRLSPDERAILSGLRDLIGAAGDIGGRFDYRAHADDPEAQDRYRELVGDDLDVLRSSDRDVFATTLDATFIEADAGEAWMRVIGDARLVLAHRLGIESDGWEQDHDPAESSETALLGYLGYLQDALVESLT